MKMNELLSENIDINTTKPRNKKLRGPVPDWPPEQDSDTYQAPDRKNLDYKSVTKRIPQLTAASDKLAAGEIDRYEYQRLVNKHKPVSSYDALPYSADDETIKQYLRPDARDPDKLNKVGNQIPDGAPVELRLDIPAYTSSGTWVVAVHGPGVSSPLAYRATAIANDISFRLPEKSAHYIARNMNAKGEVQDKTPIATIKGKWEEATPAQARAEAEQALASSKSKNPQWIQIGMDPERHSYFYDRKTTQIGNHKIHRPVESGSRVIQVGSLVFLKDPVYGDFDTKMYELSIQETLKQIDEEIIAELSFHGSKCTQDCSGHKAGFSWEKKHNQNVRQQTPSNSFNNGTQIATDMRGKGRINAIGSNIKNDKGQFTKFQQIPRSQYTRPTQ